DSSPLLPLEYQCAWTVWVRFVFERQHGGVDEFWIIRLQFRNARTGNFQPHVFGNFPEPGFCQYRNVLLAAKDEVVESSSQAPSVVGKPMKPGDITFVEFFDRRVTIGTTHTERPTRLEATMHLSEMEMKVG